MSEDKQLTVAELLARTEGKNPGAGQPRPRRRRSLEEGGVSVAELTGSIKKVEARPPEVKHSNVPIDAPAEPNRASTAGTTGAKAPATPGKGAAATAEKPAAPVTVVKPAAAPVSRPVKPAAEDTAEIRRVEAQPAQKPAAGSSRLAARPAGETGVIPAVRPEPSRPAERGEVEAAEVPEAPATPGSTRDVDRRDDAADAADLADPRGREVAADEVAEDDSALNPIMLVLLVFAGVIVGILGFLAFQWVWAHMKTVVAAILALAAVLAVIFGVRAMRTGRDTLTTVLAGVAGAVMAFGPALIV
ncbi:hypothetical protein [Corynebacterium sp. UBA2622]|uniref:hypothetical protein n=1 Tax=Corynebacterium sp. UBA2622 TaxID=1946393 RepID=UPI0025B83A26|nr:hypothetical protein [Corynebacterium sp. UBA2622]